MTASIESPPKNRRAGHRPEWLKIRVPGDLAQLPVSKLMNDLALNTVCQEARCPNIFECWSAGTATFMILGETEEEVLAVASDLRDAGVDIITFGQYLAPTGNHHPVRRYYTPDEFTTLGNKARALGFHHVESAPLVRSSYMAHRALE